MRVGHAVSLKPAAREQRLGQASDLLAVLQGAGGMERYALRGTRHEA